MWLNGANLHNTRGENTKKEGEEDFQRVEQQQSSNQKSYYHKGKNEGRRYACTYCDKTYNRIAKLNRHMEEHTDNHKLRGDVGQEDLPDRQHLEDHMQRHEGNARMPLAPNQVDINFDHSYV